MKLTVPVSRHISDSGFSKIKAENTNRVLVLIKNGKTVDEICRFPNKFPKRFVDEVMQLYLFEVFSKNARYHGGEYLIDYNGKVLIDKSPTGLRQKFEKELAK